MKKRRQIMVFVCLWTMILAMTACGESGSTDSKKNNYTWDDVSFTVKSIGYSTEATESEKEGETGKLVSVIIDFGKIEVSQRDFESNVAKGKFTLAGRKPDNYNYHMGKMVFGGTGFVQTITGEAEVFFKMDADYELDENDLEIKE